MPTPLAARILELGEDALGELVPALTRSADDLAALGALFAAADGDAADARAGDAVLAWLSQNAWRADADLAPVLALAAAQPRFHDRVAPLARDRVVEGPLVDAL